MNISELFWNASVEDLKKGYIYDHNSETYICLCCGESYMQGFIYEQNNQLMDALRMMKSHIEIKHESMFNYLLELDKKYTTLTDNQRQLVKKFYDGLNDKEIAKSEGTSNSTIRNQRFQLREKAKQAKIFLTLMELLEEKMSIKDEN